jgi:glycosyltransferase involved in cell wall biosynthesis
MAGYIDDIMMATPIAAAFAKVKDPNIKLILHERQLRSPNEPYFQQLREIGGPHLHLSLTPVAYSEIGSVYRSADIGLVFYDPSYGDNLQYIVGASGKLTHYLMFGIPVISNNLPGFKEIIEGYQAGIVINELDEIGEAISTIMNDYSYYSANALKCFKSEYDFDGQFNKIYNDSFRQS